MSKTYRYLWREITTKMIEVKEALKIIDSKTSALTGSEVLSLTESVGLSLIEDIISPINMPPFRQSAMDGYAICIHKNKQYKVVGEIKAGDSQNPILKPGEAVRIFTGAPVPDSSDAVIMQEKTIRNEHLLNLQEEPLSQSNIRPLGEQIKKKEIALKKGTILSPAAIGFLTTLGISKVTTCKKPSVGIIVTGSELVKPGNPLKYGQIYESNGMMLSAALQKAAYNDHQLFKVSDDYEATLKLIKQVFLDKDLLLISGGISVGDYDFVGRALEELKVEQLFYKIKQKPGKPLFFGKKENKFVFALPGNPAAALSCFYIYVMRCMAILSGNKEFEPTKTEAISSFEYVKKGNRAQFLKAHFSNGNVQILDGQSSAMLHSFSIANALVYIDNETKEIKVGDKLKLILLP